MQESDTQVLDFPEDQPLLLGYVLKFIYSGDLVYEAPNYRLGDRDAPSITPGVDDAERRSFWKQCYCLRY
jgi:hypothetical protein